MLLSWSWLREYVPLECGPDEFAARMMMAGLNHESTEAVGNDWRIDLEVTSNRADCLGHIGLAREAAVLFDRPLKLPAAEVREGRGPLGDALRGLRIEAPELCPRYIARVIRGVRVGPSPAWLRDRLATIGIAPINNVVDVTNYVLMETGQPLHAFDLARLAGPEIIVRRARRGERLEAINHSTYELTEAMCVIADRDRPVAIAGVMGGAASEVTASTTALLIEAALFDPLATRVTSRGLGLRSDSSYRFERGTDAAALDWVSRRCCELILEVAGGELAAGALDVGERPAPRAPIALRWAQVPRVLGIEVPRERTRAILAALGCREQAARDAELVVVPPSWRADLSREIDLIEEVARVHGYEQIPEDVSVPMCPSARSVEDRALTRVRHVLTAAGFDEAMTVSAVDESLSEAFSPWTAEPPLVCRTPVLERADRLRRSLVPSLLRARRENEAVGNRVIELFETARVYLPRPGELPREEKLLGLSTGGGLLELKGVVEAVLAELCPGIDPTTRISAVETSLPLMAVGRACELRLDGALLGYLGELSAEGLKRLDLRGPCAAGEVLLGPLVAAANLAPQYVPVAEFPAIERDINLVVEERVAWAGVAAAVREAAGELLESLAHGDTYRDPEKLGPGKKSLLVQVRLRGRAATLTGAEADAVRQRVVEACAARFGAVLRA